MGTGALGLLDSEARAPLGDRRGGPQGDDHPAARGVLRGSSVRGAARSRDPAAFRCFLQVDPMTFGERVTFGRSRP